MKQIWQARPFLVLQLPKLYIYIILIYTTVQTFGDRKISVLF